MRSGWIGKGGARQAGVFGVSIGTFRRTPVQECWLFVINRLVCIKRFFHRTRVSSAILTVCEQLCNHLPLWIGNFPNTASPKSTWGASWARCFITEL